MQEYFTINRLDYIDMEVYQYGREECEPGHFYGPAVRDHYLIHFIHRGKGIYVVGDKTYELGENQIFLIYPDTITYYEADKKDPWIYSWIGFNGIKAEQCISRANLSRSMPVLTYNCDSFVIECFNEMMQAKHMSEGREYWLLGVLYKFLSKIIAASDIQSVSSGCHGNKDIYVNKAVEFIMKNYSRQITVKNIAQNVCIDRKYLYAIFKELLKVSPQEFLIKFRMDKACELMKNSELNIGDIARSVGYEDQHVFSKSFKKVMNISPSYFRKSYS